MKVFIEAIQTGSRLPLFVVVHRRFKQDLFDEPPFFFPTAPVYFADGLEKTKAPRVSFHNSGGSDKREWTELTKEQATFESTRNQRTEPYEVRQVPIASKEECGQRRKRCELKKTI